MNYLAILRQCIAHVCFFLAAGFVLSLTAFLLRKQLRVLLDRWRALGRLGQCVTLVFVTGFVLYGGSKNTPSAPPSDDDDDTDSHLEPLFSPEHLEQLTQSLELGARSLEQDRNFSPPLQLSTANPSDGDELPPLTRQAVASTESDSQLSTFNSQLSTIQRWHARGAWEDWQHIEFPSDFAFPIGTNQITEVVLMSQGSLRTSLANQSSTTNLQPSTFNIQLPYRVSLEPGESTVSYGLTASNSFLVAWENACVERSATNRVNASIELFRNGDTLVTVQPTTGNQSPTTIFTPASLPEGWVGEGQNTTWATNTFPEFAENIATNGYENWLADFIGINEANGRYQVKVSIMSLPNGPCYLQCGPYKVVVKQPGVYCFPLEYFTKYYVRTYPKAVPLTFEYDDGYRPNPDDFGVASSMAYTPQPRQGSSSGEPDPEPKYEIDIFPQVYVRPNAIPLNQALNQQIDIFCKAANITSRNYTTLWGQVVLHFTNPSQAVIEEAEVQSGVLILLESHGYTCSGMFTITEPWYHHSTNDVDNVSTNDFGTIGGTNGTSSAGN